MSNESENDRGELEQLSALADGELDERRCRGCLRRLARATQPVRASWQAYQLIGDVLRSDDLATDPARDAEFLARLRARLASEPVVLAPPALSQPLRRPSAATCSVPRARWGGLESLRRRRGWLRRCRRRVPADAQCPAPMRRPAATLARVELPVPALAHGAAGARRAGARTGAVPGATTGRRSDPRRAPRPLPGRAQAVRRQLGARRAVGVPAQRHRRSDGSLVRSRMLTRSRFALALICTALLCSTERVGAESARCRARRRPRATRRPGCCASTRPRAARTSRAPSWSAAAAASPAPASRTTAKGRTRTSASSRSTARRATSSATTTWCTPSGRRARSP